jgi:hypothetical protein
MDVSHPERRTPTFRQFAIVMAAITWFALLLPVGARAAGQLVTLTDPVNEGKARVVAPGALRVAEYNNPARLPYADGISGAMNEGARSLHAALTPVPAGYRLVIETVSVRVGLPAGQRAHDVRLAVPRSLHIPLSFAGRSGETDYYAGTVDVAVYVDPETTIQWDVGRTAGTGICTAVMSLFGHLVKV